MKKRTIGKKILNCDLKIKMNPLLTHTPDSAMWHVYQGLDFLSKPQPNLNTTVGFYMKMTLQPPPPPTHHTNSKSAISQLLPTRF